MKKNLFHVVLLLVLGMPLLAEPAKDEKAMLDTIEKCTFNWFWDSTNPDNGLVPDRTPERPFSSVAAVGFGLTAVPIGIERGYVSRKEGVERVLTTLRFLKNLPQGVDPVEDAGYKGFYYHFLHMDSGKRYQQVELSTIDTALCMMGVLFCQSYFEGTSAGEREIRSLAEELYTRVQWSWAVQRDALISMGWKPEQGFLDADYKGYDEAMFLYILALGSPTYPVAEAAWSDFLKTNRWERFYGQDHIVFAPLFGHQYAQSWIDFRGIQDAYVKELGIDYFENSRRAAYAQQAYAIDNPMQWKEYGPTVWGLTACDGPEDDSHEFNGELRRFYTYRARGADADYICDDGTIAPTAAVACLPFAPEIVLPAIEYMLNRFGRYAFNQYGFVDAFNPSYQFAGATPQKGEVIPGLGWFDSDQLGIDQGPILLMLENYRSGFVWDVFKRNPHIQRGLRRAGFTGGWLDAELKQ
ncbi:MAG: hypothetical protein JW739_00155 [Opitutales bacterium]|nr:hypothetical protein [Opitutales bacterium]